MAKAKLFPQFEAMADVLSDDDLPYVPPVHPDRTGPGIGMSKQEFCRVMGVSRYDLDRACEMEGAPVIQRGSKFQPWVIPSADMMLFLIEQHTKTVADPDLSPLRRNQIKLILSQCEKAEIKNTAMRRELVTVDEAVIVYRDEAAIIRKHARAIPDAVLKALGALKPEERTDASVVQFVVADVINDALRAMSTEGVDHVAEAA